jgi:hypothetical protein
MGSATGWQHRLPLKLLLRHLHWGLTTTAFSHCLAQSHWVSFFPAGFPALTVPNSCRSGLQCVQVG